MVKSISTARDHDSPDGVAALTAAALIWGCFPLYWHLLNFTSSTDVLCNRIIWSVVVGIALKRIIDGNYTLVFPNRDQALLLLAAASLLSFNWGLSIYAVHTSRVTEGGIGMFFAPMFQIAIALCAFNEELNRTKQIVLLFSGTSAVLLVYELGGVPYIAIGMGASFAAYAAVKKRLYVSARDSFILETGMMVAPALVYLSFTGTKLLDAIGQSMPEVIMLIGAGVIAAPPLILYGFGAQRATLSTSAMIINIVPIMNIIVGVAILGEPFTPMRIAATALVACAVFYYTWQKVNR